MPPVIAFVVATLTATAITVGVAVVTGVATYLQARKSAKKMEDEFNRIQELQDAADKKLATQQSEFYGGGGGASLRDDTKLMLKSSKSPRNVVFGRDRVSGPVMPFFSYEQNGILYHRFGVVLAGHECDAIETVYFDDEPVTLDTAGWVVAPAKYTDNGRGLFCIEKKLGGAAQTASQILVDAAAYAGTPAAWDASRRAVGVCYVVVHMEANYDVLHDVGLPNISAVVRGVKAYDPRTLTTAWTRNPALLARWWLVDSVYSPLTLDSDIDQAELIASANVCDEAVAFSATVTAQRYACDGALSTTANPLENLNKIMSAMDGDVVWVAGKWQLIAGYYKAPTLSIDESHIAGGQITIAPYAPTAQIINAISGQYKGPDSKYQAAGYPAVAPPAYQSEDGGELYERKDDFDLVNDAIRCQMIAWQRLSRARQQLAVNLTCNLKAYNSSPLQSVSLSLAEFGYSNKVFQVRKRVFSGMAVEYFLQETGAAVWAWSYANATAIVELPNINVAIDLGVAALQNVAIESGGATLLKNRDGSISSRMRVTWGPVPSYFVKNGGWIEWQYRRTADVGAGLFVPGAWLNAVKAAGNATEIYIDPVLDGVTYNLRGRAISQLGTRGEPTALLSHTVIGKTEPPADVVSLSIGGAILSWPAVPDIDLAGYELRYQANSGFDWASAAPLSYGLVQSTFFDSTTRPVGVYRVLIKAVDTTGNYSLNTAAVMTTLPDNVQAFSIDGSILSWTPVGNSNIAGYELRFHYGNNGDWGTATPITSGLVTESPFDMVVRPSGMVSVMIKAIDTSGNYAYIPAQIVANLGDAPLANVVETLDYKAAGWPSGGDIAQLPPGIYDYTPGQIRSFSRAVTATYINASGLVQNAALDVPRYQSGQLLIEAAATNLLKKSTDWTDNSFWLKFDYSLSGYATNLLPANAETTGFGGGWTIGANLIRIGTTTGPTGLTDAVIYQNNVAGNAYLRCGLALLPSATYKLAVWARVVSGTPPASGALIVIDADRDGIAGHERAVLGFTGIDTSWRRFFLEITTGTAAGGSSVYIATDWGNGAQIAFAQPVLVNTQGLPDFANITLNDPVVAAPDGSLTAMRVSTTNAGLFVRQLTAQLAAGQTYTPSLYVYYPSGPTRNIYVNDDTVQVSVALTAAPGWQRLQFPTFVTGAAPTFIDFETGIDANPLWVWGPQMEPGAAMSSLIITGASTGARAADFAAIAAGIVGTAGIIGGVLLAGAFDSFYDNPAASFYGDETDPFYITSAYGVMVYTTPDTYIGSALAGSVATLKIDDYAGSSLLIEYRMSNPSPKYGAAGDSFYGSEAAEFYPGAGVWMPWPGQITAVNDVYQFRITIGSGATQGRLNTLALVIDAPDILESVNDLAVSAAGTAIPYSKPFTAIKNIQATLQANGSGAVTVEIDKTSPLTPTAKCFNAAHTAVSGATVDFILKGY